MFSSSNGSSVDEFEHAESPRLESGFYSNVGEEEPFNIESPDLKGSVIVVDETRESGYESPARTPLSIITQVETRTVHSDEQETMIMTEKVMGSSNLLELEPESPRIFTFQ